MIMDQRHRPCSIRSGELYLCETVHLLEALVATDLGLARLSYGSHQFFEATSIQHRKSSCSTSDVLDSLHAGGLTPRRRLQAPPVERGLQPPCAASTSCGHHAVACRGRFDWCPCASLPRRWAFPPVSPLPPPRAVCPLVLRL